MARELVIDYKDRIPTGIPTQRFDFYDDEGKKVPLGTLFGKTTTWPDWSYGLTREIDGHTWWIILAASITTLGAKEEFRYFGKNNEDYGRCRSYTVPVHLFSTVEQRAYIQLTDEEKKIIGTLVDTGLAVRDDCEAWDIFYGTKKDSKIPVSITVKKLSDAINNYINVTKPKQKAQKEAVQKAQAEKAAKILPIADLPLPKQKTGRGQSNATYVFAKMLNDLNHNQKAIINMILQLHK